jgi:hypothetical protein
MSGMHEEEEGNEHMPDCPDLLRVFAARLVAFAEVRSLSATGGEIDWPINSAVRAASEP